jgi:hypothetical protein
MYTQSDNDEYKSQKALICLVLTSNPPRKDEKKVTKKMKWGL